ncbi:MAG: VOC family protein [Rhizobiaceae bacterium]|nr:VOC family protein [Rhizobiaceae bacterium]
MEPRPLDHLVLPVASLKAARERLTALGFTVAPDGIHPFGTANCCVFFDDGTFLEPLAVADASAAAREADAGNVFVSHDHVFRGRNGDEGFSALVYGTSDAAQDHAAFEAADISAGDMLTFAREFATPDGGRDRAEFRLAFAADEDAPDCLFFTCERVAVPKVDRSALLRHANGVTGIAQVLMSAPAPSALSGFLEKVTGTSAEPVSGGIALQSGAFELRALAPSAFADATGLEVAGGSARFRAVAFACLDPHRISENLLLAGIDFNWTPAGVIVPPAPGQGAAFIFLSQDAA